MGLLAKIVKNDAMKTDPPEIYNWRVYVLSCSACFAGALFGMDTGIIGGVLKMETFRRKFGLSGISDIGAANLEANIVSTLQAGCFFGALGAYWFADKYGRRTALFGCALIAIIGTVMQAVSLGHLSVMYVGRLITGIAVGAASMLNPLYTAENAPRAIRGALTGMYQFFIVTGICVAFWINYSNLLHTSGDKQFTISLALQALPAVCLGIGMLVSNESPRWLARTDQWEKAATTLAKVRNLPVEHEYVQSELAEIRENLEHEQRLIAGSGFWDLQKEMWTIRGNRNRALLSIGLMVCQQMTGTNAINYYAPQIFSNLGLKTTETGLFATGIYGIVKMATCAFFLVFVADSLGRRKSLLWTSIAQGASMFYIGFYVRFDPPVKGQPVPPAGYVAIVMIFLFASFFQFGWGPVCWIYVSEIPSARLRAMNVGLAAATQWLFNFVVARATPNMMVTVGKAGYGTYFIYGTFCFAMYFFAYFWVPETKGLGLEDMDQLFGVIEHKYIDEESAPAPVTTLGDDGKTEGQHIERN
ncbi:general substrate transporter [Pyronema domesticum]|uniref:Similar to Quinate permease acc. no. P15325 n=1 Tax=Pyronema omphalodes (strain CBS 100304) TaxID=1076935 RepID=U4LRA5_PYROM|nr:general substrate transporter [Pyronema domesticum]CCX34490.1 Similar to Quinate permease; acc. no. P15325 [Pyronema omphalodes CBS 100304]